MSTKREHIHVRYSKSAEAWRVIDGTKVVAVIEDGKRAAVTWAAAYCNHHTSVRQPRLLELYIHRLDGSIEDRRTYPRSSDPKGRG